MASARKTCRKTRYRTEYEAAKKLKRITWVADHNDHPHKIPVRYYWHHKCQGFHLTSAERDDEEEAA